MALLLLRVLLKLPGLSVGLLSCPCKALAQSSKPCGSVACMDITWPHLLHLLLLLLHGQLAPRMSPLRRADALLQA